MLGSCFRLGSAELLDVVVLGEAWVGVVVRVVVAVVFFTVGGLGEVRGAGGGGRGGAGGGGRGGRSGGAGRGGGGRARRRVVIERDEERRGVGGPRGGGVSLVLVEGPLRARLPRGGGVGRLGGARRLWNGGGCRCGAERSGGY